MQEKEFKLLARHCELCHVAFAKQSGEYWKYMLRNIFYKHKGTEE